VIEQDVLNEQEAPSQVRAKRSRRYKLGRVLASVVVLSLVFTGLLSLQHDSDGDGLSNSVEQFGWRALDGTLYVTDPYKADTDGDGLTDRDEAGEIRTESPVKAIYQGVSNPTKADSDDDGLGDNTEVRSWHTIEGVVYRTKLMNADTDGDGLTDGEEAGELVHDADGAAFKAISNPTLVDSDKDALLDLDEYILGTDLMQFDTDEDKLSDFDEVALLNTDPRTRDSDGDGDDDYFEIEHVADGFDPLEPQIAPDPEQWAEDFFVGATNGAFEERDTIAWLAGNVTQGGTIFIPGVGEIIGVAGDVRDSLAQALRGEYGDAAWAAIGIIPGIGIGAVGGKIAKFVGRLPQERGRVDKWVDSLNLENFGVSAELKLWLRKKVWGSEWDKLKARGFTDQQLADMTSAHRSRLLEEVQARPSSLGSPVKPAVGKNGIETGASAEQNHVELLIASKVSNVEVQRSVDVSKSCGSTCGPRPTRRYDVCSGEAKKLVCHEVKAGYTPFSTHVREEIARDVYLLKKGKVDIVEYHFYWSEASKSIGADPKVLELLRKHNIPYKIHPPS